MEKEKKKCVACEDGNTIARDLCSSCWSKWRHGKIDHPTLGKFVKSDKGAKELLNKINELSDGHQETPPPVTEKKTLKTNLPPPDKGKGKSFKKPQVNTLKNVLPENPVPVLFHEIRKRFREIEALSITLNVLGQGDQVKKEMELFVQRFV